MDGLHLLTPKLREKFEASITSSADHAARFDEVERFCLFLGYPRSGHTIVASMLAAHPDAAIAIELDALRYVAAGFGREQIYTLLMQRSVTQSPTSYEYDYTVAGQWQGRVRRLRVIGDKEAGMTNLRLRWEPDLIDRLRDLIGVPLRVVHIVRHPLDNITTMLTRGDADHLRQAIGTYFRFATNARDAIERLGADEVMTRHQESLIADPRATLEQLCQFLGLEADPPYLDACASIVMSKPKRTRESIDWPASLVAEVKAQAREVDFLSSYDIST